MDRNFPSRSSTNLNVLQTLTTEAELANGAMVRRHRGIGLAIPSGTRYQRPSHASAIHPPVVAYGPVSTTASTSQVGATLALTVPVPLLDNQVLNIPSPWQPVPHTLSAVT